MVVEGSEDVAGAGGVGSEVGEAGEATEESATQTALYAS